MDEENDSRSILARLRTQLDEGRIRFTLHAQQEMVEEDIKVDDVYAVVATAQVLEEYPEHRRGACCLLSGNGREGRPVHVVCTTERPWVIIITAYEPLPPKWVTPIQRGRK